MMLNELNSLQTAKLQQELFKCCGSTKWSKELAACFPFDNIEGLMYCSDKIWAKCSETDFLEAFTHHPKIGDIESLKKKFAITAGLASNEQSAATTASKQTFEELSKGNDDYEKKFGYIFIVCATAKTADEMLDVLFARLSNTKEEEIKIAANEQNKITHLKLNKLIKN